VFPTDRWNGNRVKCVPWDRQKWSRKTVPTDRQNGNLVKSVNWERQKKGL
jgi:hypothetical protein